MIRKYREEDLEAVLELWYEASLVAHWFLTAEFLQEERTKLRDVFLPQSETWVYELDGAVVGFLSLVENEVGGLFIRPSAQRQGIGKALMDKAASLHPVLVLDVFEKNGVGRPFYAKYGFIQVSKQQDPTTREMLLHLRYTQETNMLPDLLAQELDVVICGTAVGHKSASLRQYYAKRGNANFCRTLHKWRSK